MAWLTAVVERRQFAEPYAVPEALVLAHRALEGEARLTGAAGPCQGYQPVGSEETLEVGYLPFAANKACQMRRKVLRHDRVRCS